MNHGKQLSLFNNGAKHNKKITNHYSADSDIVLYHGDRLELIREIADSGGAPTLIVTSPPYNVGKEYEQVYDFDKYIEQQRETIEACVEVLADNGSICWQVGHYVEGSGLNKEAFPLDLVLYPLFKSLGLKLKNRIVWTFGHGLHEKYRFSGRHETILWFVKSDNYIFNLDPIRVPQKYPGKRAFRGQNKGKLSGNPQGKNPSDIWDMPNVKANHIEKTIHPCQFPLALVERLILSMTNPGDLVLDPYLGSGTTIAAAVKHDRRAAGSDTEGDYIQIGHDRAVQAINGTLPYREMNKPVYKPDPNSSVASVPTEWLNNLQD